MNFDPKAIRRALMIAKDLAVKIDPGFAVHNLPMPPQGVPLERAKGGPIKTVEGADRERNLAEFMRDAHPSIPKVLYHGTTSSNNFPSFSDEDIPYRGGLVAFFSEHPDFASGYAENEQYNENKHGRVIPVHVNIKNPFDFRKHADLVHDFYNETGGITDPVDIHRITLSRDKQLPADEFKFYVGRGDWSAIEAPEFARWLRERGHDGVIMKEQMTRGEFGSKDRRQVSSLTYGIFDPTQVKSAVGNVGTFDPTDPDITKAEGGAVDDEMQVRNLNQMGMYSAAAEAARNLPQERGTLQQMLASLKGVKPDEINFSDVQNRLGDKPIVTKQELADYFSRNIPKLEVTSLDEDSSEAAKNRYKDIALTMGGKESNYTEDLIRYSEPFIPSLSKKPVAEKALKNAFYTEHYPAISNILAHVRHSDREGPNGEKLLHLEELQSDWGQTGKKHGFENPILPGKVIEDPDYPGTFRINWPNGRFSAGFGSREIADALAVEGAAARAKYTPLVPHVGTTSKWMNLALKHALNTAVKGNYDGIIWTPGDKQVERYKGISEIGGGLKYLYDNIVPKQLLGLAKEHDPSAKVESLSAEHDPIVNGFPMMRISPKMRESIKKRGFKAFSTGGFAMPQPVDSDKTIRRALMIAKADGGQLTQSPALEQTFALENRPAAIVSPRPGKGGGPPIIPESGAQYDPSLEQDREPWSFATPDIIGAAKPPPVQHPVFNEPRMRNLANATAKIFKTKGFNDLVEGMTGLRNLTVMPTVGTWKNELEPSFIIQHPDMTPEHAEKIAHLLGFGFQQDAAVHTTHNPDISTGIPAVLIGNGKKLTQPKIDELNDLAGQHGLDFTVTGDGKAAKFLHFGDEVDYGNFLDKINEISKSANLPEKYHARTTGDLINAKGYLNGIFGTSGEGEGIPAGAQRSPDLFRGVVDHVLAPYAKAVAGEGYRLSPERLKEAYGLTDEETDHVRNSLYPTRKGDRTTIPLMTGEETLDVRPTGSKGKSTVGDVLYALQNRAASLGQIEPGDYSNKAMDTIARHIADEVNYHVQNSPKSAVGWYDKALKAAMQQYAQIFPEIVSDPDKELLFHSILGITSQGNDVFSNSTHAARVYNLMRNGASLPDAVKQLRGSFGDKTRQIEQNLLKLHHLVDNNGYDKMRDVFNRKMTVSEWNKLLNKDETLYGPDGKPLSVDGGKDQKVTGWSVFGPKIGSFINNLHGDYSTLTADLWFSRTWNRLLGYNFVHTPLAEAKQYRDFRDALKAEYYNSNPNIGVSPSYKTENGKIVRDSKGNPAQWDYGVDAPQLSKEDFDRVINDPDEMLKLAQGLEEKYRKSQYREKSDLRRRAKNWIENRELPEALPRSDLERNFQQNTVEKAQKLLKQKYGMDISIADIQAALWFHEKELFGKLGVASEKAAPADYADAASKTVDAFNNNSLYTVKSKSPPMAKQEIPMVKEAGGAVDRALQVAYNVAPGMMSPYGRR